MDGHQHVTQMGVDDEPDQGDITPYLNLITSEHADKPNFIASVTALLQPIADIIEEQCEIVQAYDLDSAIGAQLDVDGLWIGAPRCQEVPLQGVYFSWNVQGLGWNQGVWKGPYDAADGLQCLSDADYRNYLLATVLANHWDGSISGLYDILNQLLGYAPGMEFISILDLEVISLLDLQTIPIGDSYVKPPINFLIQDNNDMSFTLVIGPNVPAVQAQLIIGGYLKIKPAGVRMNIGQSSVPGMRIFGWGLETNMIGGWGEAAYLAILGSYGGQPVVAAGGALANG